MKKDKTNPTLAQTLGQECIAMRIRLISRAISRIYDEALRPHGLKASQLSILGVISLLGRAEPGEVCRILHLDASTLSRNVNRMRTKGWLDVSSAGDRRAHQLKLTPEGNRILAEAFPAWREAQDKATSMLGEDNAAAIERIAWSLWFKPAAR
jgi:DNA-binding MarR family transcriptional regulator